MVKFDRAEVIALINEGFGDSDEVDLAVSGEFEDGISFKGSDIINLVE